MKYGLIGGCLGHSFSKGIHEQLAEYTYELTPLNKDEFTVFMEKKEFQAINVTIPYKMDVIPYLHEMDAKANSIGAVNTIVNHEGKLYGYNTDYDGFLYMLRKHRIPIADKKAVIFGDGGAAQAIKAVLADEGIKEFYSVRRSKSETTYTYEEIITQHSDADIIINTSPSGMYPNCSTTPLSMDDFPNCRYVIDIVYNPLHTQLLVEAKEHGVKIVGGLEMLIAQAKYAVEHFLGTSLKDTVIDEIYRNLVREKGNIVLIGMPSCGKTTIGKQLAQALHKTYYDSDEEIVKQQQRSIRNIIEQDGEPVFRALEAAMIQQLSNLNNCVIATGGGCIKNADNMMALKRNGVILWIQRDLEYLLVDEERPLSSSKESIEKLYEERYPLYLKHADAAIENNDTLDNTLTEALNLYEEIIETY